MMTRAASRLFFVLSLTCMMLPPSLLAQWTCEHAELQATPNRPSVSSGADTTQCGVLEMEAGFEHTSAADGSHARDFATGFRYGLNKRVDLFWNFTEYTSSAANDVRVNGVGDHWLGARARLIDYGKLRPAVALMYLVKAPTASVSKGLGSGYVDHQLTLIASKNFGAVHVDMNAIGLASGGAGAWSKTGVATCSISGPLYKNLGWNVETRGGRAGLLHYASQLTALTYAVNKRFVLDLTLDAGLTHGADHRRIAAGFTYALGRIGR